MDSKQTHWHWGLATGPNLELSLLVARANLKALRFCPVLLPDQRTPCAHPLPKRKLRFCEQHKQECRASHAEYKSLSATVLALRRKLEAVLESLFDSDSDPDSDSVAARRGDRPAGIAHVHGSGWSDLGPRGGCAAVDAAAECVVSWRSAIVLEIAAREPHHQRFFPMGGTFFCTFYALEAALGSSVS